MTPIDEDCIELLEEARRRTAEGEARLVELRRRIEAVE
jgi:hypothetical protein